MCFYFVMVWLFIYEKQIVKKLIVFSDSQLAVTAIFIINTLVNSNHMLYNLKNLEDTEKADKVNYVRKREQHNIKFY